LSAKKKDNERMIVSNPASPGCLYRLTTRYLSFLGTHGGSLQPNCLSGHPNSPHPTKTIVYSLALDDLRDVRFYLKFFIPNET